MINKDIISLNALIDMVGIGSVVGISISSVATFYATLLPDVSIQAVLSLKELTTMQSKLLERGLTMSLGSVLVEGYALVFTIEKADDKI